MSSINWPEILAIFVGFGSFFIYLMHRLDANKKETNDAIEKAKFELNAKIELKTESLQKSISSIASKVSNIEGQITQMTRPGIPIERYQQYNAHPPEDGDGHKNAQGQ